MLRQLTPTRARRTQGRDTPDAHEALKTECWTENKAAPTAEGPCERRLTPAAGTGAAGAGR